MEHEDFVAAYRDGRIRVRVDPESAARLVSGRLLLPFVLLPVLGLGVALALIGHWVWGGAIFLSGLGLRALVRASSRGFILSAALSDPARYREFSASGLLAVEADPPDQKDRPGTDAK